MGGREMKPSHDHSAVFGRLYADHAAIQDRLEQRRAKEQEERERCEAELLRRPRMKAALKKSEVEEMSQRLYEDGKKRIENREERWQRQEAEIRCNVRLTAKRRKAKGREGKEERKKEKTEGLKEQGGGPVEETEEG